MVARREPTGAPTGGRTPSSVGERYVLAVLFLLFGSSGAGKTFVLKELRGRVETARESRLRRGWRSAGS
jgi:hypothetical protein